MAWTRLLSRPPAQSVTSAVRHWSLPFIRRFYFQRRRLYTREALSPGRSNQQRPGRLLELNGSGYPQSLAREVVANKPRGHFPGTPNSDAFRRNLKRYGCDMLSSTNGSPGAGSSLLCVVLVRIAISVPIRAKLSGDLLRWLSRGPKLDWLGSFKAREPSLTRITALPGPIQTGAGFQPRQGYSSIQ